MSTRIKGLSQFIADLRAATTQDAERARVQTELASLRRKLPAKSKAGYEAKKAVAKILYVYILGYPVDLGARESLALIQSQKYSEKQIGYLALELMLSDNQGIVDEAMDAAVLEDLRSPRELYTALALNFVSMLRIPSRQLVEEVFKLLVSPTSAPAVARKAALTVASFYRQDPTFLDEDWAARIVALVDSTQLGLAQSCIDLVIDIARTDPDKVSMAFPKALRKLHSVWSGEDVPLDYVYYQLGAPWLVVKLLELLRHWVPIPDASTPEGQALRAVVLAVVTSCAQELSDDTAVPQHANARKAILFEAVRVSAYAGVDIRSVLSGPLGHLLHARDPNTRYLALQTLAVYPPLGGSQEVVDLVLGMVKDRDVSVRREALDALSSIANSTNVEHMAAELLDMLVVSDGSIRPQMVSRLAGIIEQFATSPRWYVDTCLSLLIIGGSYVGEEVWQRLVQITVNNASLRSYCGDTLVTTIRDTPPGHLADDILKAAAFILGEYTPPSSAMDVFVVLQDRIGDASMQSLHMLLTCYLKLASRHDDSTDGGEFRSLVMEVMERESRAEDAETQQRATEYLRLLQPDKASLLKLVCQGMPAYSEKGSLPLFAKLAPTKTGAASPSLPQPLQPTKLASSATGTSSRSSQQQLLSSNWEHGFRRMLTHSEAVLFQDSMLQVGCRYSFDSSTPTGKLRIYLRNVSVYPLSSMSVQLTNPMGEDVLVVRTSGVPAVSLDPGASTQFEVDCEARQPFAVSPTMRLTYMAGSLTEMAMRLPITLERFMAPVALDMREFLQRWGQLQDTQFQKKFRNWSVSKAQAVVDDDPAVLEGLGWGLVPNTPPKVLLGAAILHTGKSSIGCLIRVEPGTEPSVTVRATNKLVSVVLANDFSGAYQL